VLNLVCFGHLTRRANQGHIGIIAGIAESPRRKRRRAFPFRNCRPGRFQFVETVSSNFPKFVDRSETVWHVGQITGITPSSRKLQSPHGEIRRGLFV
jgi:hypothetical protein